MFLCLCALVCIDMCWCVMHCVVNVVFVVLLVASVLASMRWLLCGGDGSEENDICNYRQISRERVFPLRFQINSF